MLFRRTAFTLAGTATLLAAAAPFAAAECGCWRYVRPSSETSDTELGGITAPSQNVAWAVGSRGAAPVVMAWNGARWRDTPVPLPADTLLEGVDAATPKESWVIGYGPDGTPRSARLSEGKWTSEPFPKTGPSFPRDVDTLPSGKAWAAGSSSGFAGTQATTWKWNGTKWRTVPIRDGGARLNSEFVAISARTKKDAWVVGTRGANPPRQLLMHWDGEDWTPFQTPALPGESTLADVVALRPNDAWAVGSTRAGDSDIPLAEHWNGDSWQVVPVPGTGGRFYSVAGDGANGIWAAGEDGARRLMLAHWDGQRWDVSTGPVPDPSGDGDAKGPASAWGLANTPGTPYLWAVGSYGREGADPLRHALTWTNSPRPR